MCSTGTNVSCGFVPRAALNAGERASKSVVYSTLHFFIKFVSLEEKLHIVIGLVSVIDAQRVFQGICLFAVGMIFASINF